MAMNVPQVQGIPSNGKAEKLGKSEIANSIPHPHMHILSSQEKENTLNYTGLNFSQKYNLTFCIEPQDCMMTLNSALLILIFFCFYAVFLESVLITPTYLTQAMKIPGHPRLKLLSNVTRTIMTAKFLESGGLSRANFPIHKRGNNGLYVAAFYPQLDRLCME